MQKHNPRSSGFQPESNTANPPLGLEARATDTITSNDPSIEKRDGNFLPHWSKEGATYFVTFRLADSLPKDIADQNRNERDALRAKADATEGPEREKLLAQIRNMMTGNFDALLDKGQGSCCLA